MKKTKSIKVTEFVAILDAIREGRARAFTAVNVALIETYAAIGSILSRKVRDGGWSMKQFHELWAGREKISPLVRELSWSNHMDVSRVDPLIATSQIRLPSDRDGI